MRAFARILVCLCVVAAVGGCNEFGYVELKAVPTTARGPTLYLDSERLDQPRDGIAVLRQGVGTRRLQSQSFGGEMSVLCDIVVRKDRITTVTVSLLERPPRCLCARPSGTNAEARRTCIG
jgi:hypothetical protein